MGGGIPSLRTDPVVNPVANQIMDELMKLIPALAPAPTAAAQSHVPPPVSVDSMFLGIPQQQQHVQQDPAQQRIMELERQGNGLKMQMGHFSQPQVLPQAPESVGSFPHGLDVPLQ